MTSQSFEYATYPVVLFDSQCLLCDTFVRWIIHWDKEKKLKFSGLQSTKAVHEIEKRQIPMPKNGSVILLLRNQFLTESDAAIEIMKIAGFPSFLTKIIQVFPKSWRDRAYKWIAHNRYRFYQKRNYCPLPHPSEASRFV